jgi:hypothetical protein
MTGALVLYSATFMRYALAVSPKNYLLFGCHLVNFGAQSTQAYRYINYWHLGGRDKSIEQAAKDGLKSTKTSIENAATTVKDKAQDLASQAKSQAEKITK